VKTTLRRLTRPAGVAAGLATLALIVAGCSNEGHPLTTLDPQGSPAHTIANLINPVFVVAGVVFVLVEGAALFIVFRFRRRKSEVDGVDEPRQTHGHTRAELAWTIAPALILAVLAVGNVRTIWKLENQQVNAKTHITVVGQQWWWEFRYDVDGDGKPDIITANQMVIPIHTTIGLRIQSNDVIHSFWIPALNGKRDAVPGHRNGLAIEADKPGIYAGQCTEFCGLSHGYMQMQVKALTRSDYDIWVANQLKRSVQPAADSTAAAGKQVFFQTCAGCHQINGYDSKGESTGTTKPSPDYQGAAQPLTSGNAPNLTHLMSRENFGGNMFPLYENNAGAHKPIPTGTPNDGELAEWLRNPSAMKPMAPDQNRGMPNLNLSQDNIDKLVAFLTTLK
jgi:cytochrome c oxidase subunit 2